jgi:CheY-like chemotaxis protein
MRSILLIDDDAMSRELFALLLEAEGYAVRTSISGDDALESLRSSAWQPDAVLCDLQMPGLAGAALAAAVRDCSPRSILIAMSATLPPGGVPAGFHSFLRKPFDGPQFTQSLDACFSPASSAPPATNSADVDLDEATLATLAAAIAPEQLRQLYALALSDTRKRVALLRQTLAAADAAAFRREAHAIKGAAAMLGARDLSARAKTLETAGITPDASRQLDELVASAARLEGILLSRFQQSS